MVSGVRFWSGKSQMECRCDVCVCVAKFFMYGNFVIVMDTHKYDKTSCSFHLKML